LTEHTFPPESVLGGQYVLREEIGRGGAAVVYRADDVKHARRVAVKVLRPIVAETVGEERFLREIEIAGRLQHPNIVALYDSGSALGHLYFVMPLVEGETLRRRLDRVGRLTLDETLAIARDIARALQHAHERGVVHRDVKPSNILVTGDAAVVADFGIARLLYDGGEETLTATGVIGTPAYMSPEQCDAEGEIGATSDIYALGCVVFEMLAGAPPYTGRTPHAVLVRHRADPVPSLRALRPELPAAVDAVVRRALAKQPAERHASAAAFVRALGEAVNEDLVARLATPTAPMPAPPPATPATPRWLRWVAVGVALIVPAIAAFAFRHGVPAAARAPGVPALDSNLIAIAPIQVYDAADSLWREGLVDLFAKQLDGAGPLRVIPPTRSIRVWSSIRGRNDTTSAAALGAATRAGLVMYGHRMRSGTDSSKLVVELYDAAHRRTIATIERRELDAQPSRLIDSVTLDILRRLDPARTITAARSGSVGSRSLPALKAFLRGEQLYRRNDNEAARRAYAEAIAADTGFALAYRRLRDVTRSDEFDESVYPYSLRAGALNRGLSRRDSLLILADSLAAATHWRATEFGFAGYRMLRRRQAALEEVVRGFPNDPEGWLELGELLVHAGMRLGVHADSALRVFDRAIAADSAFAPAYYHAIELSATVLGRGEARRRIATCLRLNPGDERLALAARLLDAPASFDRRPAALLDTISAERVADLVGFLRRWNDPGEASVKLLAHLASRRGADTIPLRRLRTLAMLANEQRGHLHEAARNFTDANVRRSPFEFAGVARLGAVPADSASRVVARWLDDGDPILLAAALDWWAARGDTASLLRAIHHAESSFVGGAPGPRTLVAAAYVSVAGRAQLARARGDSVAARRAFLAIPDSLCVTSCVAEAIAGARLLEAAGQSDDALALLDRMPPLAHWGVVEILWTFERARLAEGLGRRAEAVHGYAFVSDAWRDPDPSLGRITDAARRGLDRLSPRTAAAAH
jgi:serine/threonine-protein kinase